MQTQDQLSEWHPQTYDDYDRAEGLLLREPFTFHDENDRAIAASFYGDWQESRYYQSCEERKRSRDEEFWSNGGVTEPLTRHDLRLMRDLDAIWDCREDDNDEEREYGLALAPGDCVRLEAIGRRLDALNPTFWRQLRRLGATPELVVAANALLHPHRRTSRECLSSFRPTAPLRRVDVRLSRCSARGPERRPAGRRHAAATSRSSSDRDGPGEPPGNLAAADFWAAVVSGFPRAAGEGRLA